MKRRTLKIISIALLLLAAGFAAYRFLPMEREVTTAIGEHYQGTMRNGRYHGRGLLTYSSGDNRLSYAGDFVDGQRSGQGVMIWKDGIKYDGQWLNGERNGYGVETYPDDDPHGRVSYAGDFVDSRRSGRGKQIWKSGTAYEGQWLDDHTNGWGILTMENGGKYEGQVLNLQRHGQDVETYPPDDEAEVRTYVGGFVLDQRSGRGTLTWKDGAEYEGEWRDDSRNGRGVMIWPSGDKYEGYWARGDFDGQGTYTWRNGKKYEGAWKDGRQYNGVEYDVDGRELFITVDGEWRAAADDS